MVYPRAGFERWGEFRDREYPSMADVPFHWLLLTQEELVYDPMPLLLHRIGATGQISARSREAHAEGAVRAFAEVSAAVADCLHSTEAAVTGQFLYPYWAMDVARSLLPGVVGPPEATRRCCRQAMAAVGWSAILAMTVEQIAERARRAVVLLRTKSEAERACHAITAAG
jgi:hypothetical protein